MDERVDERFDLVVGKPVTITVRGAGPGGYGWNIKADPGRARVRRLSLTPSREMGGEAEEVYEVTPLRAGDDDVVFELRQPWDEESTVRRLTLRLHAR